MSEHGTTTGGGSKVCCGESGTACRGASRSAGDAGAWTPPRRSGLGAVARAFALAAVIAAPMLGGAWGVIHATRAKKQAAWESERMLLTSLERVLAAPAKSVLGVEEAARGRDVFLSACASCHGATGEGVPKLGKDLVRSWFVASKDDAALLEFLVVGRGVDSPDNTTKIPMPPRGGREDLTDEDLRGVVAYLRGLQDGRRMPALPAPVVHVAEATADEKAAALAAAGGDAELAGYIASGTKLFAQSCAACHGKDARGIAKNGKDLVDSDFCKSLSDDDLLAFIMKGRDPSDPKNTTGVGMPAKGGNPALSEDDILDIISYLRSLESASAAK